MHDATAARADPCFTDNEPAVEPESKGPTMTTHDSPYDNSLYGARAWFAENGLTRPREGRLIGGVTAGFARRYGVNLFVARVAAIVGVLVLTPLLYLPLWVLMPTDAPST
jgi:phage shock protein PspC (stress-responsive transcriptional regulator)